MAETRPQDEKAPEGAAPPAPRLEDFEAHVRRILAEQPAPPAGPSAIAHEQENARLKLECVKIAQQQAGARDSRPFLQIADQLYQYITGAIGWQEAGTPPSRRIGPAAENDRRIAAEREGAAAAG